MREGPPGHKGTRPALGARVSGHVAHQASSASPQPTQSQGRGEGWAPGLPAEQEISKADAAHPAWALFASLGPGPACLQPRVLATFLRAEVVRTNYPISWLAKGPGSCLGRQVQLGVQKPGSFSPDPSPSPRQTPRPGLFPDTTMPPSAPAPHLHRPGRPPLLASTLLPETAVGCSESCRPGVRC